MQRFYFRPICYDLVAGINKIGVSPGAVILKGYDRLSLVDHNYQWYAAGSTISIVAIFIALYYYRL